MCWAGNIAEAIHLADSLAPGMLAANPSLQFRLHLQTFYDLVQLPAFLCCPSSYSFSLILQRAPSRLLHPWCIQYM